MPRVKIARPDAEKIKQHQREYAVLHALDPKDEGVDSEKLAKFADRGDEAKVKQLASKSEASFDEFAAAFRVQPTKGAEGSGNCLGVAAFDESSGMRLWRFDRRALREDDVRVTVTYAGICHSDIHQAHGDWGNSTYPMCPGHEMIGVVTEIGANVSQFKVGDFAAVGNMVDSCGDCARCKADEECYCDKGFTPTYNGKMADGEVTHGGYSTDIVTQEKFVFKLAPALHCPGAAPLLCAGITVWSPMRYYGADKKGMRIGVEGLGGLGHMAVKFGKAFGCHVTVLSRSEKKKEMALKQLGADAYIATGDEEQVKAAAESLDAIIDTVSATHDMNQLLGMLKVDGKLICVGIPSKPHTIGAAAFIMRRRTICGSLIGGLKETQEMLDFCADKGILSEVEVVDDASQIDKAYERTEAGDVRFRFVIDNTKALVK